MITQYMVENHTFVDGDLGDVVTCGELTQLLNSCPKNTPVFIGYKCRSNAGMLRGAGHILHLQKDMSKPETLIGIVITGYELKKEGEDMETEKVKKYKRIARDEKSCRFRLPGDKCSNSKGGYSIDNPGPCSLEACPRVQRD